MIRYEKAFPEELIKEINKTPIAFFPLGTLEWHGWHMVLGTDAIKAHELCLLTAEKTGGVVLPPFYFGTDNTESITNNFRIGMDIPTKTILPGSCYYLDSKLFRLLIDQIIMNLVRQGFKVIIFLIGHYPKVQRKVVTDAIKAINTKNVNCIAIAEYELVEDLGYTGDHAGKWETSILTYLNPKLVDLKRLILHKTKGDHMMGVDGENPDEATMNLGEHIVEIIVDRLVSRINQMKKLI